MIALKLLVVIPGFLIGAVVGAVLFGITPTLVVELISPRYLSRAAVSEWVSWATIVGALIGIVVAIAVTFFDKEE